MIQDLEGLNVKSLNFGAFVFGILFELKILQIFRKNYKMMENMNKNRIRIIVLLLLLQFACLTPIWEKVEIAKRRGNLKQAENELKKYLQLKPRDAKALFMLGEIRAQLEDWEGMIEAFSACLKSDAMWKKDVENSRKYYLRKNINEGIKAIESKQYDNAISLFKNAIIIEPKDAISFRLLGESYYAINDIKNAIVAFEKAIQLDPKDVRSRRYLMKLYFNEKNYLGAIQQGSNILNFLPNDIEALRIQAYSFDKMNKLEAALSAYNRLIQYSHNFKDFEAFAAFQYKNGQYHAAIQLNKMAIQKGGDPLRNYRAIAQSQFIQQRFRDLENTVLKILKINSNDVEALRLLLISYTALGEKQKIDKVNKQLKMLSMRKK